MIDLPEGASVEATDRVAQDVARIVMQTARGDQRRRPMPAHRRPFNFNGLVRHYYLRAEPQLGDVCDQPAAQGRARPRQPRHRARHPAAAVGARRSRRHQPEGRRAAARTAGDLDAARRGLRPRRRDAPRGCHEDPRGVRGGALRRRRRRQLRRAGPAHARDDLDRRSRVLRGRGAATSSTRSPCSTAARRSAIRTAADGRLPIPICRSPGPRATACWTSGS